MEAIIVTIGDELLMGQVQDTNSGYIAKKLTKLGINLLNFVSIKDNWNEIWHTIDRSLQDATIVILTGGLGPTKDDITKKVLAAYFQSTMSLNDEVLTWIRQLLEGRSVPLNDLNKSQAILPDKCQVLRNTRGTASGMWFSQEGKILVSLPGVPFEMEGLMEEQVLPRLTELVGQKHIDYRMLKVYGVPESVIAAHLAKWEEQLPDGVGVAYLPSPEYVRMRITTHDEYVFSTDKYFNELRLLLSDYRTTIGEENSLQDELKQVVNNKTISTAESCTGGNIAHLITSVPGSSVYFQGSVVAYQNSIKEKVLGVPHEVLEEHGAVSEPVVRAMAEGVKRLMDADYGVATSGVAGPSGGTIEKPVGTVWIAVAGPNETVAQCFHFSTVRERNIGKSTTKALEMLINMLTREN